MYASTFFRDQKIPIRATDFKFCTVENRKLILKSDFFFNETKFSACITTFTKVFGKIHQLLHHWYWSVIPVCRTRRRACWFSPEEDCSERSTEVIIIISKPRRRLTHTWNPFFFVRHAKGQCSLLIHKQTHTNERRVNRSTALKVPTFFRGWLRADV